MLVLVDIQHLFFRESSLATLPSEGRLRPENVIDPQGVNFLRLKVYILNLGMVTRQLASMYTQHSWKSSESSIQPAKADLC